MDSSSISAGARRAALAGMSNTPASTDRPKRGLPGQLEARSSTANERTSTAKPESLNSTKRPSRRVRDSPAETITTAMGSTTLEGAWSFASPAAAEAARPLGMREGFGTAGVRQPSADQVWAIRQMYRAAMDAEGSLITQDPTAAIELIRSTSRLPPKLSTVFATAPSNATELQNPGRPTDQSEIPNGNLTQPDVASKTPARDEGYGIDEKTGLAHEPTNGFENNQSVETGRTKEYATKMFGEKKITMDRAPAKLGHKEPHKLWHYDGAKWTRWVQWQKMDFESAEWIDKLNKYRDQSSRRAGWPKKREGTQPNYTKAELEWVFELVKQAGGKTPRKNPETIAAEFNAHFGLEGDDARTKGGMRSLIEKLCREYQDNDGHMAKRQRLEKKAERDAAAALVVGSIDAEQKKPEQTRSAAEEEALAALIGLKSGF